VDDSPNLSDAVRLRRLDALRLSSEDRKKYGFVMEPLTAAQILAKRRCMTCRKSKSSSAVRLTLLTGAPKWLVTS
jgi:hypothetical protein